MIYHIAQLNIARMLAPADDPIMADFMAQLDEVNGLADESEGFVWRLQTEEGDATVLRRKPSPSANVFPLLTANRSGSFLP
jgi:hypothetical protein